MDVIAIARAAGIPTGAAVARYTSRRGSLLRFGADGACVALDGTGCAIHRGRPLACRLYPLGLERNGTTERFIRLDPAAGSAGRYGDDGTVGDFLAAQDVEGHLALNQRYRRLIVMMRERIAALIDFATVEPREFWRSAVAEALRETNFDDNHLITALFDADGAGCDRGPVAATVEAHLQTIDERASRETDPHVIATAAVLLAVSLGYSPAEAVG